MTDANAAVPLKVFIRPERRFVAEGRPAELVVLVRLVPAMDENPEPRKVNLAVVLDASSTMRGDRLEESKRALIRVIDAMSPDDRLSVVAAGDFVDAVVPNQRVADKAALKKAVTEIHPAGVGQLYPAWFGGAWEAARRYETGTVSRVVVVTDGMSARAEPDELLRAARGLFRRGISTSTLGVGDGFIEDMLAPLGVEGGGSTAYVVDPKEIGDRLIGELQACRTVFSELGTLRFDVENAEVVDVLNDFNWLSQTKVALPPLYGETPLNVVIRLRIRPGAVGEEIRPLTVRVKSLNVDRTQTLVHRKRLRLHVVSPDLADGMAPDVGVQAQAARLEFARTHRKCVQRIDAGDFDGARELIDFSVARFQAIAGGEGGTLLTEDIAQMRLLRQRLERVENSALNRKFFTFSAIYAQRSGFLRPTPPLD